MENNTKDLISILKKERELLNLTRNQLAKNINMSHTSITRIENEEMNPTLKTFIEMANALGYNLILQKEEATEIITSNNKKYTIIKRKKY